MNAYTVIKNKLQRAVIAEFDIDQGRRQVISGNKKVILLNTNNNDVNGDYFYSLRYCNILKTPTRMDMGRDD